MPPRPNAAAVERPRLRTTQRTECIFITQLPIMTEWRAYLRDVGRAASAIPFINSFGARQRGESCSGRAVPYMRARRFCIARASSTATYAHLNSSAAQRNHHARSRATSMSMPRDLARSFVGTEGFKQSQRERKKIEIRFAHLKRILRLGRLPTRGPRGAQDEFGLAVIAQNLRRIATLVARPPPAKVLCIA